MGRDAIGETNAWAEVLLHWVVDKLPGLQELEGALAARDRLGAVEIEVADAAPFLSPGRSVLVAHAQIGGQFIGDLEIVLRIKPVVTSRDPERRTQAHVARDGNSEQKAGVAIAAGGSADRGVWALRVDAIEEVTPGRRNGVESGKPKLLVLDTHLHFMAIPEVGNVILKLEGILRREVLAGAVEVAYFRRTAARNREARPHRVLRNAHRRKSFVLNEVRDALRKPQGRDVDTLFVVIVVVLEARVTET